MSEHHPPLPAAERTRQALAIVRYILETEGLRATAARYAFPIDGSVLGEETSVLFFSEEAFAEEVNQAAQAIGGIPAQIEQGPHRVHVNLMQWHGADPANPAVHNWNNGDITINMLQLLDDLEMTAPHD